MAGSLLYARDHRINDNITIKIPTVGEVLEDEDGYYDAVCSVVATPYEMMVKLDDIGIDFTKITEFELFCLMFNGLKEIDTSRVFGDLDLSKYHTAIDKKTSKTVLWNPENDSVIDWCIHGEIAAFLRRILFMEKDDKKPGNEEARKYMIERARKKMKRRQRDAKPEDFSRIESALVALVNTSEFHYTYETVRELTVYQFFASLRQIAHKIKFDNTMIGLYAGTVKLDDLRMEDRSWIKN